GEEVASTLIKTLRCEWIHGFIADFFNTIHPLLPLGRLNASADLRPRANANPAQDLVANSAATSAGATTGTRSALRGRDLESIITYVSGTLRKFG
ncbi:hypothetical protein NKH41_29075, partial [Mesorhizobium sp. M1169]|uniref:hypothetical protein n=1 Tax=unclassified Mesorhizobium TaxID=325217 RepID=UPI00333C8493